MKLTELLKEYKDPFCIYVENEKDFVRFSRTTSRNYVPVCVYVASEKYIKSIPNNASMIITTLDIASKIKNNNFGICISENPKVTYFRAFNYSSSKIGKKNKETEIGNNSSISRYSRIAKNNVIIGDNVVIEDYAIIYENVVIGDNCIIRAGAKVGIQDYNYYEDYEKSIHIKHHGTTQIGDDVEIGYNTVIGQALYPDDVTHIGNNVKIGFHCTIAHDDYLDDNVMIYSGVVIGGYTSVGKNTRITINSAIRNGLSIGENVQVNMGSVVIHDIPDNARVFGNPAKIVVGG